MSATADQGNPIEVCKKRQTEIPFAQKIDWQFERPQLQEDLVVSCPQCQSEEVHTSKRRGILENSILTIIFVRPFRCEICDFRFLCWSMTENPNSSRPATTY
jgi:hypothetical protein